MTWRTNGAAKSLVGKSGLMLVALVGAAGVALTGCGGSTTSGTSSAAGAASASTAPSDSTAGASESASAGGATGDDLNSEKLVGLITAKLNEVVPGATVKVTCPDKIVAQAGAVFSCEATVNNQPVAFKVTQKDGQGNVNFQSESSILFMDKAQTKITEDLTKQVPGNWTTTCNPEGASGGIYVAAPGSTFDCSVSGTTASGDAKSATVVVTVKDADGNITWKLSSGQSLA